MAELLVTRPPVVGGMLPADWLRVLVAWRGRRLRLVVGSGPEATAVDPRVFMSGDQAQSKNEKRKSAKLAPNGEIYLGSNGNEIVMRKLQGAVKSQK
jgi:hypothetical protein